MKESPFNPGNYITLKEIADLYSVPKVTINYYVLRGLLIPVFMIGKTNLFDKKSALKIVKEIMKEKGQNLDKVKNKLNIK